MTSMVCPRSSDPFYIVLGYNIKWVTTSWTDGSTYIFQAKMRTLIPYIFTTLVIQYIVAYMLGSMF